MSFVRTRPVAALWLIAVALELVLIPIFIVTGADAAVSAGLAVAGLDFNSDLLTGVIVAWQAPAALGGLLLALAQVGSPDLALVIVGCILGQGALAEVARRFRFWSPAVGWRRALTVWAALLVTCCACNLASAALHARGPASLDFSFDPDPWGIGLVAGLLVAMFLDAGGLLEENAWRGFVLPRLQARMSPLRAATAVGLLWAGWHVPVKFGLFLDYGVGPALVLWAVLVAKFVALSVMISYFFNRAGEATLVAVALHGLSNDSVRLGGLVRSEAFASQLRAEIDLLMPLALAAVGLILLTRGRLGQEWDDGPMFAPLRRPRSVVAGLGYAVTGLVLAGILTVLVPVVAVSTLLVVGLPLAVAVLVGVRAVAGPETRAANAFLGTRLAPPSRRPSTVLGLVTSGQTWRTAGWLVARALAGTAAAVVLLVLGVAAVALAAVPFVDGWLDWAGWSSSAGLGSAWTLLLLPLPLAAAVYLLDGLSRGLAVLAPRLLGPDPAAELEALRDRTARLRDRSRLATELHDSIGHTLTVVTIQAAAAGRALDTEPDAARRALEAIELTTRRAGAELDAMIAALGADDQETGAESDLADLPDLALALQASGVPATYTQTGPLDAVPPHLGAELFRMSQELCANVLRHAGSPPTAISLTTDPHWVVLSVRNDLEGSEGPSRARRGGGRGLDSIARRAQRLGGAAVAEREGDQFVVRIEVPLPR